MGQDLINETLKQELKKAIALGNKDEIDRLTKLLKISPEQTRYFDKGLTGYPSIDQVWLDKYKDGAYDLALSAPKDKTMWDVIEEKLLEYYDIPALEYFGRIFSKQEFIDTCYEWARTFRAMGVAEDEVVPIYGPVVPDIAAMVFGLNMIGATPYFLKLAISPEALAEETKESKIAVVYDGMWANVASEFSKDKFKNVIVATVTADMPSPKKEIVSFLSKMQNLKNKSGIPDEKKYIWADKAKDIANYYSGDVKVPFKENRSAIITSSSGTTVGGVVKGVVATNESVIAQVYSGSVSEIPYFPGDRVLNHFPFTASTSLNSLYMLPLFNGLTVLVDPRVSENDFYNQLINLKPNIALNTGSAWEAFFNRVEREMARGKRFDFSYAKGWTIGGEGTDTLKYQKWNDIMIRCGAKGIYSGYGLSEVFSAATVEKVDARYDLSKQIMSVGLPQAGMVTGVFDKKNNEVSYNQRGELKIRTDAAMKEYYNKPEMTDLVKQNGWISTGDLAEIDENGFVYVWGRMTDKIMSDNGTEVYLFDVANKLKENEFIDDAMVLRMPISGNENNLVAHIVWNKDYLNGDKDIYIATMNEQMSLFLPNDITLSAYAEHDIMLPYSPTTLKKDKNKMSKQLGRYIQIIDGELVDVEFAINNEGKFSATYSQKEKSRGNR